MTRVLIVGEAPSASCDGNGEPLSGRSGRRLAALCELTLEEYLATFERANVLPAHPGKAGKGDRFRLLEGIPAARDRIVPLLPGRRAVLLGRAAYAVERALLETRTYEAYGLSVAPFAWRYLWIVGGGLATITCCPHPSGVSRWWNDPENRAAARKFWRTLPHLEPPPPRW